MVVKDDHSPVLRCSILLPQEWCLIILQFVCRLLTAAT